MSTPLDLDGPPACQDCGTPMIVKEWPGEGPNGASLWSAVCSADTEEDHGEIVDRDKRPTWRTEPGCAALVAEVERLRAERQAILDAGSDALWAGGATTLPEAVAGVLHALDVELTRSMKERDRSPAARVRDALPHVKLTDADLVKRAARNAGMNGSRQSRWDAVNCIFQIGAGVAPNLCRACGLDPDEMVGDDGEGEE